MVMKKIEQFLIVGISVFLISACASVDVEPSAVDSKETQVVVVEEAFVEDPILVVNEPTDQRDIEEDNTTTVVVDAVPEPVDFKALKVNELGHVMVVMYHGIKDNPPYHRTRDDFLKDLTYMYEHNYRPISVSDYMSGHIDVEAGMTPIVLTFDDGLPTTFSMVKDNDTYRVDEDTAVGIMESFALEFPDFGKAATMYIHGSDWNFRGEANGIYRMEWLIAHGYEIGNHSNTHQNIKKLDGPGLLKEIGEVDVYVGDVLPDYKMTSITYPFGARPDEVLIPLMWEGVYEGHALNYQVAFREGPSGIFYPPTHVKFSPYNAPRVRGSEGEIQDLWWFFEHYEANPGQKYISDGNPDTITVPLGMEDQVNPLLEETMEVITY